MLNESTEKAINKFGIIIAIIASLVTIIKDGHWSILAITIILSIIFSIRLLRERGLEDYGDFDIIFQEDLIEIEDVGGKVAHYKSVVELSCKKKNGERYDYCMQADANITDISVYPGVIEQTKTVSGLKVISTNMGRSYAKDERVKRQITASYNDCFINAKEYWTSFRNYDSSLVRVKITMPIERPLKSYFAYKIVGIRETKSSIQPTLIIEGKKQCLVLELKHGKVDEDYKIEWEW